MEGDAEKGQHKILQTPVQHKRQKTLGIRYSAIKNISKTLISEIKSPNFLKSASTELVSPKTPLSVVENNIQNESKSTGYLTYTHTSISRRKVIRKKRLQFVDSTESSPKADSRNKPGLTSEETNEPKFKKFCDNIYSTDDEKHREKVHELEKLILVWKEGFREALNDLSKKLNPPREKDEILELLNIAPEMIKYG